MDPVPKQPLSQHETATIAVKDKGIKRTWPPTDISCHDVTVTVPVLAQAPCHVGAVHVSVPTLGPCHDGAPCHDELIPSADSHPTHASPITRSRGLQPSLSPPVIRRQLFHRAYTGLGERGDPPPAPSRQDLTDLESRLTASVQSRF